MVKDFLVQASPDSEKILCLRIRSMILTKCILHANHTTRQNPGPLSPSRTRQRWSSPDIGHQQPFPFFLWQPNIITKSAEADQNRGHVHTSGFIQRFFRLVNPSPMN